MQSGQPENLIADFEQVWEVAMFMETPLKFKHIVWAAAAYVAFHIWQDHTLLVNIAEFLSHVQG